MIDWDTPRALWLIVIVTVVVAGYIGYQIGAMLLAPRVIVILFQ